MEGFTEFRLKPWVRRLATRLLSIVPAALVAGLAGDKAVNTLLGESLVARVAMRYESVAEVHTLLHWVQHTTG